MKAGIITEVDKTATEYHDISTLFKIYRSVSWRLQMKVSQVKSNFQKDFGTDIEAFLDSAYQAGMDFEESAGIKSRLDAINSSHHYLKLIDEAVNLLKEYHPQGERYYFILYYTYLTPQKADNIDIILDKLEPHFPHLGRINKATYYRWREKAFKAVSSILWGYEGESKQLLLEFHNSWIYED